MCADELSETWYHGSPLRLTILQAGSTITQDRELARVFSHKPTIVSADDEGEIWHNGTEPGLLYRIAEELRPGDVYPHPRSSMESGKEWLTRRDLYLELIGPTEIVESEQLTEQDIEALLEHQRREKRERTR